MSLYEQLGGRDAVEAAVDIFYRKMLSDGRVNHFFDGVDMDMQIARQKRFLIYAFGGPNNYSGKNIRDGHAHLVARGLDDAHVDIVIGHLGDTLKELGAGDDLVAQVAAVANSVRDDVLNR